MNQKIENLLNLALEATPEERERSGELDVGYDPEEREIFRESGTGQGYRCVRDGTAERLRGGRDPRGTD